MGAVEVNVGVRESEQIFRLAELHAKLTTTIIHLQSGKPLPKHVLRDEWIQKLLEEHPDVIELDRVRREIHRKILEVSKSFDKVKYIASFALPDVEAVALAAASRGYGVRVEADRLTIFWEDEGETVYGDPVGMTYIEVAARRGDGSPSRLKVRVEAEIVAEMHELMSPAIPTLDLEEYVQLALKNGWREDLEFLADGRYVERAGNVYDVWPYAPWFFLVVEPDKLDGVDLQKLLGIFDWFQHDGKYYLLVDGSYSLSWAYRLGLPYKSGLVDELRKLGFDAGIDRVYHELPAEYDAGADGRILAHLSILGLFDVQTPLEVVEVEQKITKLIELLTP